FCSDNPAELSSLVVSCAPCAARKLAGEIPASLFALKIERDQTPILARLSVNHTEGCPRQRHDYAVILNLDAQPRGFSHACSLPVKLRAHAGPSKGEAQGRVSLPR